MKITKEQSFPIAIEILKDQWPRLDHRTIETIASQVATQEYESREAVSKKLTTLVGNQFPHLRAQRQRRGKLVSVDGRPSHSPSAELDPESTISGDQRLTEIALQAAEMPTSSAVMRGQEQAADRVEHILVATTPKHREVLERVIEVVEPSDSIREIAKKISSHPAQVTRAFEAARRADKVQIFSAATQRGRRPVVVHTPKQPSGVPFEVVMMTHQGATITYIGPEMRTSIGRDVPIRTQQSTQVAQPPIQSSQPQGNGNSMNSGANGTPRTSGPAADGCKHENRQWLKAGFADLRKTCLDCKIELGRTNPFAARP